MRMLILVLLGSVGCVTVNEPSGTDGTGGGSSASSSVGNGGNAGGGVCLSTTCQQEGKNCGQIDDGCGQKLECGTCSGNYQVCGEAALGMMAEPNVCGGGCTADKSPSCMYSANGAPAEGFLWTCNTPGNAPPGQFCDPTPSPKLTNKWCCLNN